MQNRGFPHVRWLHISIVTLPWLLIYSKTQRNSAGLPLLIHRTIYISIITTINDHFPRKFSDYKQRINRLSIYIFLYIIHVYGYNMLLTPAGEKTTGLRFPSAIYIIIIITIHYHNNHSLPEVYLTMLVYVLDNPVVYHYHVNIVR